MKFLYQSQCILLQELLIINLLTKNFNEYKTEI
jgi:hypothetical protein